VAGSIVPATEEISGLRQGVMDITYSGPDYANMLIPYSGIYDCMSGGLTNVQLSLYYQGGEGLELVREAFAPFGVYYVGPALGPAEDFAYTTVKLDTVADLNKLKMRSGGDGAEILNRLGAACVFMPAGEIYESMQRGVINAFEYGDASLAWPMGFHEVMDYCYISLCRGNSWCSAFFARTESYEALPEDLKMLIEVAQQAEISRFYAECLNLDGEYLQKMRDYGVQVLPLPKEIEDAFLTEAVEFYDGRIAKYGGLCERSIKSMRAWKELCEAQGVY